MEETSQPLPNSRIRRPEKELSDARKTVQDLAFKIEKAKLRAPKQEQKEMEESQYANVMKEIEEIKQEIAKLKLDKKHVLKEKKHADNVFKVSSSKKSTLSSAVERIKKEIEELDEEQVLAELARIEAVKEREAIEAQKKEEANLFQTQIQEIKKKAQEMSNTSDLLYLINGELQSAKTELADIRREGFNFMASMDVIRTELKNIREETGRFEKQEEKRELTIQTLNSKILKGKEKLESVTSTTEKANTIASNLSTTVDQLRAESETSRKEKEIIDQEFENIKLEIPKIESEIELSEERLEAAMEELKTVKSSEFKSLENLKNLIDSTIRARDSSCLNSATITITKFEYEYLTGKAGGADAIADKKVAAARAWVEALKANEREILMKVETCRREISDLDMEVLEEDLSVGGRRRSVDGGKVLASPRRSTYKIGIGNMTPGKRARSSQKFLAPTTRQAIRSASFTKKREKTTRNLGKFLVDENSETGE